MPTLHIGAVCMMDVLTDLHRLHRPCVHRWRPLYLQSPCVRLCPVTSQHPHTGPQSLRLPLCLLCLPHPLCPFCHLCPFVSRSRLQKIPVTVVVFDIFDKGHKIAISFIVCASSVKEEGLVVSICVPVTVLPTILSNLWHQQNLWPRQRCFIKMMENKLTISLKVSP